jgi:hypothetical protein
LFYSDLFCRQQGIWVIGVLMLYLMGSSRSLRLTDIVKQWGLTISALAALGLYGAILAEPRYVGVFVVLFWADLLANTHVSCVRAYRKLTAALCLTMSLSMLMNIVVFNLEGFTDYRRASHALQQASPTAGSPSWPGEVAETLHQLGVQPGDNVAVIGYAFDAFWARLARVHIVAELLDSAADAFWLGEPSLRSEVIQAFAGTGAKAIIAEHVPRYMSLTGWHQVGHSNYYVYLLDV